MSNKSILIFISLLTAFAIVIGFVAINDSKVSEDLAYTNIDDVSSIKVSKLELDDKKNLVIEEEDYTGKVPNLVGADKDEHGCKASAGYSWCAAKKKCLREWEEPCEQSVTFEFLTSLKKSTKIDFSGVQPSEFIWQTERGPFKIIGKRMDASRVKDPKSDEIQRFFETEGFTFDPLNISAGTISSSTGFKKEKMFCMSVIGVTGYKYADVDWEPTEPQYKDIEIYCGQVN